MTTAQTQQVVADSKSERAYAWIRERISRHVFGPGYRLVLGPIANELGMSVVPVREAIRRLEAEGLVTFERNVGARVTLVDEDEYVHTMEMLGILESAATALAAPHLTEGDLARALTVNDRMRGLLDPFDAQQFARLNQGFHAILFERCANPELLRLTQHTWGRLSGVRDTAYAISPERAHHSVDEHVDIVDLIRSGAPTSVIEQAMRAHRSRSMGSFLDARHHPLPHD